MKNYLLAVLAAFACVLGTVLYTGCNATSGGAPITPVKSSNDVETSLTTNIAFTGWSSSSENAFSFVALESLAAGTTIFFTDAGWDNISGALVGGSVVQFTPSKTLPPGTQVLVAQDASDGSIVYQGVIRGSAGPLVTNPAPGGGGTPGDTMGLTSGDSDIIAYSIVPTGPSAGATVFLTALNGNLNHAFLTSGSGSKANTYVPPGLQVGVDAIDLFYLQAKNAVYGACGLAEYPNQITNTALLAELVNTSNWVIEGKAGLIGSTVQLCDFTANINSAPTAIPSPYVSPTVTLTPEPCGYPGATCTPTVTATVLPGGPVTAGSIAFTGLAFNGSDQISFASTDQIGSGVVLYFTDYSYDPTNSTSPIEPLVDESVTAVNLSGTPAGVTIENLYENPGPNGQPPGYYPEPVTVYPSTGGLEATTITEGIISYTTGPQGLSPYHQVVIGKPSNGTDILQGGTIANVMGSGGLSYLILNANGAGHKVLAYTIPSAGVTTWLAGIIFGPDTWTASGPVSSISLDGTNVPCFWDSYLPPGLGASTSTDLSGVWAADDLSQYNNSADKNDNAVLQNCWSDLADIVNPGHWVADGNAGKSSVVLNPPLGITAGCSGQAGYVGALPYEAP